jgi:hypothetical protein
MQNPLLANSACRSAGLAQLLVPNRVETESVRTRSSDVYCKGIGS